MNKRTVSAFALGLVMLSLIPAEARDWSHYPPRYAHHSHHHGGSDDWVWGLTGLLVGGALVAAATQPVVYAAPPPVTYAPSGYYAPPVQAQVYNYPPAVPPGMCRWERFVLDGYGQPLLDQYGEPIREYTIGSCQAPPY